MFVTIYARVAVSDAIKLLGNASAQISKLRRKKILKAVNPDIQGLAEEDILQEAAPNLFGRDHDGTAPEEIGKKASINVCIECRTLLDLKPSFETFVHSGSLVKA